MGLFKREKVTKHGEWTVVKGKKAIKREATHMAEAKPECAKKGCHKTPGNHRFKQKDAEKFCKNHAHPDNQGD